MKADATSDRTIRLLQTITRQFDKKGLRDLCFVLGIDEDDLRGATKKDRARELATHVERQGRLPELEQAVGQMATRAARNRRVMIERVRRAWVHGVLERSLHHESRLVCRLLRHPGLGAVRDRRAPPDHDRGGTGAPARQLEPGARVSRVFDELGGALLILGAPGAGKTTLLLELAGDLLDRAARDPEHPIPVVFHLSSWALRNGPLDAWLVDELNQRYDVPHKMARAWVEGGDILPLLDGLDEVAAEHRAACAEAIGAWRQAHGPASMAVCCRAEQHTALAARLRLEGALAIAPLARAQVDATLEGAGPALAGVRRALVRDETLYELLDTPLMVSVVALCQAWGQDEQSLGDGSRRGLPVLASAPETLEERRERLLAAYVEATCARQGVGG